MVRSRPELPSDPEPDGREKEATDAKKRRRKRRDEERDEAEAQQMTDDAASESAEQADDPEPASEDTERLRREVAAEVAFRERVALTELADRLSPESYAAVQRALGGRSKDWRLEKGRYLFTFLTEERSVPAGAESVQVEQKLALDREDPPVRPERVDELVAAALVPGEPVERTVDYLEPLQAELPPGDEVRVRPTRSGPEIVVTAEAIRLEPESVPERPPVRTEPDEPLTTPPEPSRETIAALVAEVEREPVEVEATDLSATEATTVATDRPVTVSDHDVPPDSSHAEAPSAEPDLAAVLELLDREAVDLNDLPPIRGGAPEPGEPLPPTAEDVDLPEHPEVPVELPEEIPEPPAAEEAAPGPSRPEPPPRRRRRSRPRSRRGREVLRWDPDSAEVVRYPDHAMRRKARKLVRRLAAEYGLKLTPQIEAYLLGIALQPHLINGRRIYSIGMNIETLISVLQVLKYNFNLTRRPAQG